MINTSVFAAILLVMRIFAVVLLGYVLARQWKLIRERSLDLQEERLVVFAVLGVSWLANFVPIAIDTAALLGYYDRAPVQALGAAYAFSNASSAILAAYGWFFFYKRVERKRLELRRRRG